MYRRIMSANIHVIVFANQDVHEPPVLTSSVRLSMTSSLSRSSKRGCSAVDDGSMLDFSSLLSIPFASTSARHSENDKPRTLASAVPFADTYGKRHCWNSQPKFWMSHSRSHTFTFNSRPTNSDLTRSLRILRPSSVRPIILYCHSPPSLSPFIGPNLIRGRYERRKSMESILIVCMKAPSFKFFVLFNTGLTHILSHSKYLSRSFRTEIAFFIALCEPGPQR
mmetsp:Transcript_18250/g.44811  ORF Transcript_18250/g.44811 Transcript_18250/m.44811 type:complete len:223 (-) Transcript_18250:1670-2338(-)